MHPFPLFWFLFFSFLLLFLLSLRCFLLSFVSFLLLSAHSFGHMYSPKCSSQGFLMMFSRYGFPLHCFPIFVFPRNDLVQFYIPRVFSSAFFFNEKFGFRCFGLKRRFNCLTLKKKMQVYVARHFFARVRPTIFKNDFWFQLPV